jgi:hypothetical protein
MQYHCTDVVFLCIVKWKKRFTENKNPEIWRNFHLLDITLQLI